MKTSTVFALLAGTALATPPACLLACVGQVSKANDDCSNDMSNVKCIVEQLGGKIESCLNSICPDGKSGAAVQAFQAVANEFQASAPSGAVSSAVPSSSAAASSAPASSETASSQAPPSSAAPSSAQPTPSSAQPAPSSAQPAPSTSAESSSCIPWTSEGDKTSQAAPTTTSAPAQTSSASVAPESSVPPVSSKPINAAGAAVANSFGVVGALAAAMLL
ncbi:Covalently-linked cell wall protein 14 [Wickerhamiella sorbophila]|uniref:Covalently-linked cell wall protein 14 n=1 Tax=Wickerhamiella sorbophila TaxID=45607 RepID=A0A2T0FFB7_9ASCO|nr:Covalently-linked cell wall protein 14 [Wickerhamiella sorbophila]PRT53691.1 Covalently-linked cell wall protein 14 [Wickerhamiella sorbophila]